MKDIDSIKAFSPAYIGKAKTYNRIIRSATNDKLGNFDGTVSDAEIEMYDQLARNNVATIITGHISVSPDLDYRADSVQLCIGDDKYILGLSRIAAKIHEFGSLAIAQISHAGPQGLHPIDINELSTADLQRIRDWFISGAMRAKKAGFDGVQIHLAHSYLLQALANADLNKRTDQYGGFPENCIRLSKEIVEGIRKECGDKFVIMAKVNAHNTNSAEDDLWLLADYCKTLSVAGIDLVEVSGRDFKMKSKTDKMYYLDAIKFVKNKYPEIKLSLVGGIYDVESIGDVSEVADFVSLSRALLSQPDFITQILEGRIEKSRCLHCNKCFGIFSTKYERCVWDPVLPKLKESFGQKYGLNDIPRLLAVFVTHSVRYDVIKLLFAEFSIKLADCCLTVQDNFKLLLDKFSIKY